MCGSSEARLRDVALEGLGEGISPSNRIGGFVDLVKIDCEGAEWDLFKAKDVWQHISSIRMEYHLWRVHTYAEVVEAMHELGFNIVRHVPSGEWGIVWAQRMIQCRAYNHARARPVH